MLCPASESSLLLPSQLLSCFLVAGRSKELRPDLLETFTRFSLAQGLTKDNLLILPPTGKQEAKMHHSGIQLAPCLMMWGGSPRILPLPPPPSGL